jgi:hypothetical protein
MKVFEKLRIIEAGETANYYEEEGKTYKLVISASAFPSLVSLGNSRPIHARRTHNGTDLLDGYIGHFTNFMHDENAVYADLVMSEALESEYNFMVAMIEKEPELLGVSVNQSDIKELDEEAQTATVTEVRELFSADLVGLPAATSSLFNNNLNKLSMSKFWTNLAKLVKSTKLARETVTTKEGKELVIIAQGEQAALGDEVQDAEGKPVEDGDYYISIGEGEDMIISVIAGKISDVKEVESEVKREEGQEDEFADGEGKEEPKEEKKTVTPEELAAIRREVTELKKTVSDLKTQLNKRTGAPAAAKTEVKTETKIGTKLSREEVQKAAAEMRKKYKY